MMNFKRAKSKAQRIAQNREKLIELLNAAVLKLKNTDSRNEIISKALAKTNTLLRMMRAYIKGDYREIPWRSILLITAGLIYFVNPFDMVLDVIPIAGLMDDAAILLWIFNSINKDIDGFVEWESTSATINQE